MPQLRLPAQLSVSLIIIQLITLAAMLWMSTEIIEKHQRQVSYEVAQTQGIVLSKTLATHLATGDRSQILAVLELLTINDTLRYAAVFNAHRELLASLGEPPPIAQDPTRDYRYRVSQVDGLLAIDTPIIVSGEAKGLLQIGFSLSAAETMLAELESTNGLIAILGLLGSILVVWIISWPLCGSLQRLQTSIQSLARGEWGHRIYTSKLSPLAPLIQATNTLANQQEESWSEIRHQNERYRRQAHRLEGLLNGINAVVWSLDPQQGRFTYVSNEAERLLGYPMGEWLHKDFCKHHVHPSDRDWLRSFLTHPGKPSEGMSWDFRVYNSDRQCLWLRMICSLQVHAEGSTLAGLLLNITAEKRNEEELAYLANHDPLTGLVNRHRFQQILEEQIADNERYHATVALLFVDFNQLKYINDGHGHHTGDEYLRQAAHHLRQIVQQLMGISERSGLSRSGFIGRLGGDEFGVILPGVEAAQASRTSEQLLEYLSGKEFSHNGHSIPFSANIGIALSPQHGNKAGKLLTQADAAMYAAKDQGRNTHRVFEESINISRGSQKVHWEERIDHALKNNRFKLYFQPIVDLHTGIITHYESLLRMLGEANEVITPAAFIGIAERFGMIRDIDRWVVENAIRAQGDSVRLGKPISLAVNLSGRHFGSTEILEVIRAATQNYRATPEQIVFEVTETAAVENFAEACRFIQSLREMGYRFALDDFGVGFATFDYLKNIQVDYIKIDGNFVRNLNHDPRDQIFVRSIAEMARGLGVQAIAEFVENYETVEILKGLGVPFGQGYYFARPQPRFHEYGRLVISRPTSSEHPRPESRPKLKLCS